MVIAQTSEYNNYRIPVPKAFEQVFSHFYFAENKTEGAVTKTLLPSYQAILIFSFGKTPSLQSTENLSIRLDKYLFIGPVKQAFDFTLPAGAEILALNFKDDAFHRFFQNIDPALLLNNQGDEDCFSGLWQELRNMNNTEARVKHILDFCAPYLASRNPIATQLVTYKAKSVDPIKAVALGNGQTTRNVQLTHKKQFGYSNKEYQRYQRFLSAVEFIQRIATATETINWLEVVAECGYYDQSQLIKDFKHYIHLSPKKYYLFQQHICNPVS